MICTIYVAKTKALISFAVTAHLICGFVFANAKSRFSYDAAQLRLILVRSVNRVDSSFPIGALLSYLSNIILPQ